MNILHFRVERAPLVVKIILLSLFSAFVSVTASAQSGILSKRISIQLREQPLSTALDEIEARAGCIFIYNVTLLDANRKVTLDYQGETLERVLLDLFGESVRKMEIRGNRINLQPSGGKGGVSGRVYTRDGKPAEYVNVSIRGLKGTVTDGEGRFLIENIEAGSYTLTASYVGLQTQEQQVTIKADETTEVFITFDSANQTLQTVEITGRKSSGYKGDYSFSATKIQMELLDIPQTVSIVTKELIQDKQALRLNDVVQHVAGVSQFSVYDDITIRGFRSTASGNRLVNGMRVANNWLSPNLVNIEKIEVIKGPASATFANTNPGGTVNMITKKPLDENKQFLSFSIGSYNTLLAQADFTGPLDSAKTLLYRLNVGYENSGSFRDQITARNYIIAPSISFLPKPGTRFNADLVYSDVNTVLDRGHTAFQNDQTLYSTPLHFNVNQPGDFLKDRAASVNFSFSQSLGRHHSFNAAYMMSKLDETNHEHLIYNYITRDSVVFSFYDRILTLTSNTLNLYFNSTFSTGKLQHNLLYGYDYIDQDFLDLSRAAVGEADGVSNFSLTRPEYYNRPVNNYTFRQANGYRDLRASTTQGIYLQDIINFNRFQLLLSFRQEFYRFPVENFSSSPALEQKRQPQDAFLPRVGLTYRITPALNIYGTYTTGFQPQSAGRLASPAFGGPFDPLESELAELGAKGEFFNSSLFAGLSIYQIRHRNILVNANDVANPNLMRQRGQEQARGVEAEAAGSLLPNLRFSLNYAYNIAKITEDSNEALIGRLKEGAAKHTSGSWIMYTRERGFLKGIGLGIGHSQVGKRNTLQTGLELPAYVIFNGSISYRVERFRLSANVYNLADRSYFVGGYNYARNFPGAPRNFMLNAGYTF